MKKTFFLLFALIGIAFGAVAQIVTTSPSPLQVNSENVVLTYHADSPLGNGALAGLSASTEVYAHIGVTTQKGSWKHATAWLDNDAKYKLTYVGPSTYTLTIGDIREYFGITDPTEIVSQICLVFRNKGGELQGKTISGGDIFVDVLPEGFQVLTTSSATSSRLIGAQDVTVTMIATEAANLKITLNGDVIASADNATTLDGTAHLTAVGEYTIVASADNGSETVSKEYKYALVEGSPQGDFPGGTPKMGTTENPDGSVTFCIAAPGKSKVQIIPKWDEYKELDKNILKYHDWNGNRYFWITVDGLDKNTYYPYYFVVDETYKVGDPYAKLVLDPYNDNYISNNVFPNRPAYPSGAGKTMVAVYCGNMFDYDFEPFEIPDHSQLVIYELLFRDFTGTENGSKGNGTVVQAIEKIPYLKELGVNAVEIMPIMEFNGNNSWGYNPNFYFAPDKAYGTPTDYKEFIDECHKAGIAVILDIALNHADGFHPWYQMYNSASNPFFNSSAPHNFSVLNDWKQENELVKQQWRDVVTFWLTEYNVDGFRFDLAKGLGDTNSYASDYDASRKNNSRIANLRSINAAMKAAKPNSIHINEHFVDAAEDNELFDADGQLTWANVNHASLQFGSGYAEGIGEFTRFYSTRDSRRWGSTVSYAESHDEERMGYHQTKYGANNDIKTDLDLRMDRLAGVAVQMLITPGPKMIWQFGELGADQTTKSSDGGNNTSPKKVIWSHLDKPERKWLHDVYATMCNLRADNPSLFAQTATFETTKMFSNYKYVRTYHLYDDSKELLLLVNPSLTDEIVGTNDKIKYLTQNNYEVVLTSKDFNPVVSISGSSASVSVPANGFVLLATSNLSAIETVRPDAPAVTAKPFGGKGEIRIVGQYDTLHIASIDGRTVAAPRGTDTIALPAGIYVVVIDGTPTKVLVR